jgi:hypothetical protein
MEIVAIMPITGKIGKEPNCFSSSEAILKLTSSDSAYNLTLERASEIL